MFLQNSDVELENCWKMQDFSFSFQFFVKFSKISGFSNVFWTLHNFSIVLQKRVIPKQYSMKIKHFCKTMEIYKVSKNRWKIPKFCKIYQIFEKKNENPRFSINFPTSFLGVLQYHPIFLDNSSWIAHFCKTFHESPQISNKKEKFSIFHQFSIKF
jgi:hypothetical protein